MVECFVRGSHVVEFHAFVEHSLPIIAVILGTARCLKRTSSHAAGRSRSSEHVKNGVCDRPWYWHFVSAEGIIRDVTNGQSRTASLQIVTKSIQPSCECWVSCTALTDTVKVAHTVSWITWRDYYDNLDSLRWAKCSVLRLTNSLTYSTDQLTLLGSPMTAPQRCFMSQSKPSFRKMHP